MDNLQLGGGQLAPHYSWAVTPASAPAAGDDGLAAAGWPAGERANPVQVSGSGLGVPSMGAMSAPPSAARHPAPAGRAGTYPNGRRSGAPPASLGSLV
jgi:hypothetical protein